MGRHWSDMNCCFRKEIASGRRPRALFDWERKQLGSDSSKNRKDMSAWRRSQAETNQSLVLPDNNSAWSNISDRFCFLPTNNKTDWKDLSLRPLADRWLEWKSQEESWRCRRRRWRWPRRWRILLFLNVPKCSFDSCKSVGTLGCLLCWTAACIEIYTPLWILLAFGHMWGR